MKLSACLATLVALTAAAHADPKAPAAPAPPAKAPVPAAPAKAPAPAKVAPAPTPPVVAKVDEATRENLPPEARKIGEKTGVWKDFDIDFKPNPFYLRGDFDGDRKADFAIQVISKKDQSDHVVVLRGSGKAVFLDPDPKAGLQGYPLDGWMVQSKDEPIEDSPFENKKAPKLRGDAIYVFKLESSSALILWNGKRFVTYWQGD